MRALPVALAVLVAGRAPVWGGNPAVGALDPELRPMTVSAVQSWGRGHVVDGCQGADVCVASATLPPGVLGFAYSGQGRCLALIALPHPSVVAHELGHCLGLTHDDSPGSIMSPKPTEGPHAIRDEDRARVRF